MGHDAVSNIVGLKIKVLPVGKGMVHPQKSHMELKSEGLEDYFTFPNG